MGDMARRLPDGCVEHLGRKDLQVKIRGFRIEVTEIETALRELGSIREAAVMARESSAGDRHLVAYLVPAVEPAPTIGEVRNFLKEKMPDHMVPPYYVFLDALPMLPNGKLDRLALPAPDYVRPPLESLFVAPRTPMEGELAGIWAEVLDLDEIGVDDNFLELGGDSLRAGQVISRVINAFRVEVPLRSLFEAPTVAEMALVITQHQAQVTNPDQVERMLAELEKLADGRPEPDIPRRPSSTEC